MPNKDAPLAANQKIKTDKFDQITEALSMPACAVSETGIFDFARGYLADHDGRSDHVGRAFLTFWAS